MSTTTKQMPPIRYRIPARRSIRLCGAVALLVTMMGPRESIGQSPAVHVTDDDLPVETPDILVVRDGWNARLDDVRRVLDSAVAELWKHVGEQRQPSRVIVYPKGGPEILHQRGPLDEIVVRLDTGGTYWSQYVYQFSHEYCHLLADYRPSNHGNEWIEEALCETASLFVLRAMGITWNNNPPYENWRGYAGSLTAYANNYIESHSLEDETLAQWYARHAEDLRSSRDRRDLNRVVGVTLLPLFEENPIYWNALASMHADEHLTESTSLVSFLRTWRQHCPERYRGLIDELGDALGVM